MTPSPRSRRELAEAPRDQDRSTFTHILGRLVAATPGARGAALVDFEGETVDYAGHMDPFQLKITGAHWLIVLSETGDLGTLGTLHRVTVRAGNAAYYLRRLEENYAVVLVLEPRLAFAVSERAMQEAIASISVEAGWAIPRGAARWFWVEVEPDHRVKRASACAFRAGPR
jgi:hypothetical protein